MPASDKQLENFNAFIESLRGRVPADLLQKVNDTFSEVATKAPDAVSFIGSTIMKTADANRVYSEARQLRADAEAIRQQGTDATARAAAYEAYLRQNAQNMTSGQVEAAQTEIANVKAEAELATTRLAALEKSLKDANIWDAFADDLPTAPAATTTTTTTTNGNGNGAPAMPYQPPSNPSNPTTPVAPVDPMKYVTPEQLQAAVDRATMQSFSAGLLGSQQISAAAKEIGELSGKPVDSVKLTQDWLIANQANPIDFDRYLAETYNLGQLRDEAAKKAREAEIEAEVQKRLNVEVSKARIGGSPVMGTPRSPVFQGFEAKRPLSTSGQLQTNQPLQQSPNLANPSSPASDGSTPIQPNLSNPPVPPQSTVQRVAEALSNGKYSEDKFDLSRDLFRG